MTEEPNNKYGSFYGNPEGQTPGLPPPKQGPEGHPCATLFAARDESQDNSGGRGRLFVLVGVLLLIGGAGAAFVAMGGKSLLSPRGARGAESPEQVQAIDQARAQVVALRTELARYRAEHDKQYPPLGRLQDDWGVLLRKTYADGSFVPDKPNRRFSPRLGQPLGPYLQHVPVNPLTNSSTVVVAGQATLGAGWTYDDSTGNIWAVAPAESERIRLSGGYFEVVKAGQ